MHLFTDGRDFPPQQISCVKAANIFFLACPSAVQEGRRKFYVGKCKWLTKSTDVLKQLLYRTQLALTGEVLERRWVATLYLHHPRHSLKMLPSLVCVLEKDEAAPHPATLPGSSPLRKNFFLTPDLEISSILCMWVNIITVFSDSSS